METSINEVIQLTTTEFKSKIFDYENEKEWKFAGNLPALIDFYADWCGPCKAIAPTLQELAKEFAGKIVIYKVDTEIESELSAVFNIRSIPSLLFIPINAKPQMFQGSLPRAELIKVINDVLLSPQKQ